MNTDTTTLSAMAGELVSLTAALGGLDALVFTGGIGEHAVAIRVAAWVIPTNEELMIARHTRALLDADARRLRS